jgi:predicted DNA-binding protein
MVDENEEKRVAARLPAELHRQAKIKAAKTGRPVSEVIREALEKWIKDKPDKDD